ncbi:DgyrCDS14814 [Dimorphilus gyrociliatus]|uniref:DgyrCDS14814 n=1 Tax=Dimorphilus gyrociliatus TaxID=2664684 RepID=A0A7I8WFC2_9ANNE|nr:DgyrCDS14814 [Dimorphilus gyrociliatus]
MITLFLSSFLPIIISCVYGETNDLYNHLLDDYNKVIKPSGFVNVSFGISLVGVDKTDGDMITFSVWEKLMWTDHRLSWSDEDYNSETFHLPIDKIWIPDVILYNQGRKEVDLANVLSVIHKDGTVLYISPKLLTVRCLFEKSANIYHCRFKYGSWTYNAYEMHLNFMGNLQDMDMSYYYGKYKIFETLGRLDEKFYPCCEEPFQDITFSFKMK